MDKFKVAKSLLKIAKMLVSGKDTYEEDLAQYNENIKDKAVLDGFSTSIKDDDIVFTYSGDETGECSIVFGEVESGDWGYTVIIDGDAVDTVVKSRVDEAYETLQQKAGSYREKMDRAVKARFSPAEAEATVDMGTYTISEINDDGSLEDDSAFAYFLTLGGDHPCYEIRFAPAAGVDKRKVNSSMKSIKDEIGNGMPATMRRGDMAIRIQMVNSNDMEFVKSVVESAGWKPAAA